MIINLRGTSGSGKTTVAKSFLTEKTEKVVLVEDRIFSPTKRDPHRWVTQPITATITDKGVALLGNYTNNCGGCDEFSWRGAHDKIEEGILEAAKNYEHVIFEGLIISGSYKRYRDLASKVKGQTGQRTHWMLLTTPLEECLQRIHKRSGREIDERMRYNAGSKWKPISELAAYMEADPDVDRAALSWTEHPDTEEATLFAHELLK